MPFGVGVMHPTSPAGWRGATDPEQWAPGAACAQSILLLQLAKVILPVRHRGAGRRRCTWRGLRGLACLPLRVNNRNVTHWSSAGVRLMLQANVRARAAGRWLAPAVS